MRTPEEIQEEKLAIYRASQEECKQACEKLEEIAKTTGYVGDVAIIVDYIMQGRKCPKKASNIYPQAKIAADSLRRSLSHRKECENIGIRFEFVEIEADELVTHDNHIC